MSKLGLKLNHHFQLDMAEMQVKRYLREINQYSYQIEIIPLHKVTLIIRQIHN